MALLLVFFATGWLFWVNAEKTIEKIESRGAVVDLGDTLSKDQREMLRDMGKLFKSEFGLELKVIVSAKHIQAPAPDSKTLFFGINPQTRRVEIMLPPLVSNALGPGLANELTQRHLVPTFDNNTWPRGLLEALKDLWQRLASLHSYESEEYRFQMQKPQTNQNGQTPAAEQQTPQ